ncbi:pyrroline-5-carboxylate reductase [uncultured Corynebacterium sp.]|uniref:pyrroline-5-carboxylate reductase n=1 Tax=uncultured Corynebacterium sp. TaxID=159447 RepID=UPI0025D57338|nr:pyrroline-5-carboxylate reductase [uncultured Corynebacterium sp.]
MTKIAVLGGGKIGEALIAGLKKAGHGDITVTNRRAERRAELEGAYGIATTGDNAVAVDGADVVFLCVKPYAIVDVLSEVAASLAPEALVVSLAAGVRLSALEEASQGRAAVRVMPNTPMLLGRGMSIVVPGAGASAEQVALVHELMGAVGQTVEVAEKDIDAATAISGSSPAYYYLMTEALIDAGVQLGLTRDVATQLATQAAAGSGEMLVSSGDDPAALRANVTSPGGTTAAAIRELEESGLRGAFYRAAQACADRSAELG